MIDARDGEQDTIDCGVGEDRATVDAIDVVANCERSTRQGGGGGGPGATAGGTLDRPAKRYTRKALKKGIAVALRLRRRRARVKVTLTADKKTAKRLGTKLLVDRQGRDARRRARSHVHGEG